MQTTAMGTVANSLPKNEIILLTLLISDWYIPYTDLRKNFFQREKKRIDKAYEEKDERLLRTLDKEMMAGINEYPLEYRRMIYKRIEAATGESAEKIEKAYFKKLEKILKRGVIKDREEYELVHSRIDELVHNTPEDDPARKDLPELERIFMNYAIGE